MYLCKINDHQWWTVRWQYCVALSCRGQILAYHPGFETHGQSHLKSKTDGTSGPTKWTSIQQKFSLVCTACHKIYLILDTILKDIRCLKWLNGLMIETGYWWKWPSTVADPEICPRGARWLVKLAARGGGHLFWLVLTGAGGPRASTGSGKESHLGGTSVHTNWSLSKKLLFFCSNYNCPITSDHKFLKSSNFRHSNLLQI